MSNLIKSSQPCPKCGSSDALAIYDTNTHCFSCGDHNKTSGTFRKAVNKRFEGLPKDMTSELPDEWKMWLEAHNVPQTRHIGYSPSENGLITPFYDYDRKLVGYQVRYLHSAFIKANNVGQKHALLLNNGKPHVTVVEDIRSALKVSQVSDVLCLFGTSMTMNDVIYISTFYQHVNIWLDGDEAGVVGAKKILDKLQLCVSTKNITTAQDPKYYSIDEIKSYLDLTNI